MHMARSTPATINTRCPEYLVVAGGHGFYAPLDTVEVLIEKQWFSLEPLPQPVQFLGSTFHNSNFYLMGFFNSRMNYAAYCKLETLLTACGLASHSSGSQIESSLWKLITVPQDYFLPVSFGSQLVATVGTTIFAYSTICQSWVYVGDYMYLSIGFNPRAAVVIPTGELVAIGLSYSYGSTFKRVHKVLKGSLKVFSFDPESQFSVSTLSRLEPAGIHVMTSLTKAHLKRLVAAAGIKLDSVLENKLGQSTEVPELSMAILRQWSCYNGKNPQCRPPTWRSLLDVLREVDLEQLSQQIEDYLANCSVMSLQQLCMSVIVSTLLQQRSLEPDQLKITLPDYVPPRIKRFITCYLKAHTFISHQMPLPFPDPSFPPAKRIKLMQSQDPFEFANLGR